MDSPNLVRAFIRCACIPVVIIFLLAWGIPLIPAIIIALFVDCVYGTSTWIIRHIR